MSIITDGQTQANPLVFDPITTDSFNYNIIPLITAGDQVALITGDPLAANLTTSPTDLFAMQDKPDGLGFTQINGLNYVWMNHELGSSTVTPLGSGQIQGARVSLFVFDGNWNVIGGKNLLETVTLGTDIYTLNTATGFYESAGFPSLSFSRFCSGYLAETGFFGSDGTTLVPMWFMGEEDDTVDSNNGGNGYGLAVAPDGTGTIIAGLGKYKKETVVSHTNFRANNSDWTVLLSSEDNADGELYLYVGKQTADNPNGLWSDAGADGSNFALYVLRVVDPTTGQAFVGETMAENQVLTAQWVEVPDDVALGSAAGLSNWVNGTDAQGVVRSTDFERLEDTTTSPDPNTFYFTTTGSGSANPNGKVHRVTVNIDPVTGQPINGEFENLFSASPTTASRYDNIVADSNGNLVVQTDGNSPEVGIVYNIADNAANVGNDIVTPIYELNVSGESSGIVEVSGNTAVPGQSSYLFDVQSSGQGQLILIEPTLETGPIATDTVKPTVNFLLDQSGSDFNKISGLVLATETQNQFQFQLSDGNTGSGIDPTSVIGDTITITKNGVPLIESTDYSFSYDPTTDLVTVNSLTSGFTDGFYQISVNSGSSLNSVKDNAGNIADPVQYNLSIDTGLQFAAFQQGFSGYSGTIDTYISGGAPGENFSTFDSLNVDGSDGGFEVQALIRFQDIFGVNEGQIPFNAQIISAALELDVNNQGDRLEFYRMLTDWDNTTTWNSLVGGADTLGGIQKGVEVATTPDVSTVGDVENGLLAVNVTNSLQAWQTNPQENYGWAVLPTGTNGVDFFSAEGQTPPALVIQYSVNEITGTAGNDVIDVSRTSEVNDVIRGLAGNDDLNGRTGDDLLIGGTGNDTINGSAGNDVLIGVNVNDLNPGSGEVDLIFGAATNVGTDTIVLGDKNNVFYTTSGDLDRAIIRNFDISGANQDKIQLKGVATDYSLVSAIDPADPQIVNTNIFFGTELIATVEGVSGNLLDLTNPTNFVYV